MLGKCSVTELYSQAPSQVLEWGWGLWKPPGCRSLPDVKGSTWPWFLPHQLATWEHSYPVQSQH
jgi:hypothetical protein